MKPTVFITTSEKGGARKSRSGGMIYHTLVEAGLDPIVLALDTNNNLIGLLRDVPYLTWDINNADESRRNLQTALQLALADGRPLLMDVPGRGGHTLGIATVLRTGMLKYAAHVVGIVPTLPDEESAHRAIGALATISPDEWIHIKYKSGELDYSGDAHKKLALMKPAAVVTPPELTDEEANAVSSLPVALSRLEHYVRDTGMKAIGCLPYLAYWEEVRPQLLSAIEAVAPGLLATAKVHSVAETTADSNTAKAKARINPAA